MSNPLHTFTSELRRDRFIEFQKTSCSLTTLLYAEYFTVDETGVYGKFLTGKESTRVGWRAIAMNCGQTCARWFLWRALNAIVHTFVANGRTCVGHRDSGFSPVRNDIFIGRRTKHTRVNAQLYSYIRDYIHLFHFTLTKCVNTIYRGLIRSIHLNENTG